MPNVPVYAINSGGCFGYVATTDPTADQQTHTLNAGGGGGGAPTTATYITTADESATLPNSKTLGAEIISGAGLGPRPAAGTLGRLYFDTINNIFYYDNVSSWIAVSIAASQIAGLGTAATVNVPISIPNGGTAAINTSGAKTNLKVGYATRLYSHYHFL